ncbi:MAG: DnaA regulatory inactivator Hda [Gammaproteobacteria bacterium]
MQQLPLEIRLADHAVFENFVAVGNELLIHQLSSPASGPGTEMLWLWGSPGSGRTHLLQACITAATDRGQRAAYVPLHRSHGLPPGILDGLGVFDAVALDDIDGIAGDAAFEAAIFRLYEELRRTGGRLIASGGSAPAEVHFRLRDLSSRLQSGGAYRVKTLDDAGRLAALQIRARFRGFELPEDTARYLLNHAPRDTASLFGVLDALDRASLAAQKHLTIPFVRSVLAKPGQQ